MQVVSITGILLKAAFKGSILLFLNQFHELALQVMR
jgi:hypothetical protein